jgi:hypothetical protein
MTAGVGLEALFDDGEPVDTGLVLDGSNGIVKFGPDLLDNRVYGVLQLGDGFNRR